MSAPELTTAEHVELVKQQARSFLIAVRAASDAGVSHALILPQLVLIAREELGEMPAGFTLPGMAA